MKLIRVESHDNNCIDILLMFVADNYDKQAVMEDILERQLLEPEIEVVAEIVLWEDMLTYGLENRAFIG